jgi:HD-GYP domain-containing protein (c-di-GMP phosphodiesterase class II)
VAQSVAESRRYGRLIMQTVQQYPPGPMRDRLNSSIKPVEEWLARLNKLEQGLAKLYGQRNLPRELRQTMTELELLHRQTLMASDTEAVYLRQLVASKKQQLASLKELQSFQNQAEIRIRKIASDLATTHAEMMLLTAKGDFNDNRLKRLDENLQEHLAGVRDMLAAMDELGYTKATI